MNSCSINRILQFNCIFSKDVKGSSIKIVSEGADITSGALYGISFDGVCFEDWIDYKNFLKRSAYIESDYYIRILFTGLLDVVYIDSTPTNCYSLFLDTTTNIFLKDYCGENLYNPYVGWDCALNLQNQTANSIICMYGLPIYYFRTVPDIDTADYTFKEYVIHNVQSVQQLKLMIPDGTMPSSKPGFSELDFDWEVDWDVEIGRQQFASAFGDTAFPKQRDLIYIPMMKRMWEVNSAYDEKNENLMWQSTTFKLGLIKYNDKSNVLQNEFEDVIDSLIDNKYEDVFGELEEIEQKSSGITQTDFNHSKNKFASDDIRKSMKNADIKELYLNHNSISFVKNTYVLQSNSQIIYKEGIKNCSDSGTISFIIYIDSSNKKVLESLTDSINLLNFGDNSLFNVYLKSAGDSKGFNIEFCGSGVGCEYDNYNLIIIDWNKSDYKINLSNYTYQITDDNIPEHKRRKEMYCFKELNRVESDYNKYLDLSVHNLDLSVHKPNKHLQTGLTISLDQSCLEEVDEILLKLSNIKYYDEKVGFDEIIKYTTNNNHCIINDITIF